MLILKVAYSSSPSKKRLPDIFKTIVITGFNTDIVYEGITYHVQTEDKGLETPLILSLVYDGGTILASKRAPYDDLLVDQFDEQILNQRLKKQHMLICAAIRGGRIEDLKRMTKRDSSAKQQTVGTNTETQIEAPEIEIPVTVLDNVGYDTIKMPKFSALDHLDYSNTISADDSIIEIIDEETHEVEDAITNIFDEAIVNCDFCVSTVLSVCLALSVPSLGHYQKTILKTYHASISG